MTQERTRRGLVDTKAGEDKRSDARSYSATIARPEFFWFPFNIGDYLRETQGLTHEEKGVYIDLLCAYANRQQPLPDDDIQLARLSGLTKYMWKKMRKNIAPIFVISNGVWSLPRLDEQIARSLEKQAKKRESGRVGGQKSWEKRRAIAEANASANSRRTLNKLQPQSHKTLPYVSATNEGVEEGGLGGLDTNELSLADAAAQGRVR
jgi:uncharacterized protein YdaU (DUF1376 family)